MLAPCLSAPTFSHRASARTRIDDVAFRTMTRICDRKTVSHAPAFPSLCSHKCYACYTIAYSKYVIFLHSHICTTRTVVVYVYADYVCVFVCVYVHCMFMRVCVSVCFVRHTNRHTLRDCETCARVPWCRVIMRARAQRRT